ncbi:ComEC/Rec2 family competence protein [Riemerella columbina]|uniref:ComEC/Rec2 family competence protein n=1 Tax=Riemerella columbina TaxID=103810 RepID=UPI002670AD8D|nr:ComEC/Rec2 family competence protein [Riemerella columbina]WKS95064.1 ComEC family competence protein [Riemerella columbina]
MKKYLSFYLWIGFSIGIALEDYFVFSEVWLYLFVGLGLASLGALRLKMHYKWLFLFLFFVNVGIVAHFFRLQQERVELPESAEITLKLENILGANAKHQRYIIKGFYQNQNFKAVLRLPKEAPPLDYQHYYRSRCFISKLKPPAHSYQFDYAAYQARQGVFYALYPQEPLQQAVTPSLSLADRLKQWRLNFINKINQSALNSEARQFLKSIILADKTEMSEATIADFRKSGLAHLLAISGTHIGIIFGFLLGLFTFIFSAQQRKWNIIISLILVWCFGIFIGGSVSVIRACIMLSIYFYFVLHQRLPSTPDAVALAGFIILILDSRQLLNVGFQLSFAAVLGIYWLYTPIFKYLPRSDYRLLNLFSSTIAITLAAQLGTLPLVLYYFHQYSVVSLLANIVVIPVMGLVIIFSFVMSLILALGVSWSWLISLYNMVVETLLSVVHFFGNVEWGASDTIDFQGIEVLLLSALFYGLHFLLKRLYWFNIRNFIILYCSFGLVRMGLDYLALQNTEVLWHQHQKAALASIKVKNTVYFWVPENANLSEIERYIIKPYLVSRRCGHYQIKTLPPKATAIRYGDRTYPITQE